MKKWENCYPCYPGKAKILSQTNVLLYDITIIEVSKLLLKNIEERYET